MGIIRDAFFPSPNFQYKIIGVYMMLCLIYMVIGMRLSNSLLKLILKCFPVLFLIIFFFCSVSSLHVGPIQQVDNLERIVFGLMFSCLGDAYIVFDSLFLHGLISFTFAHFIYIAYFGENVILSLPLSYNELVVAAAVGLVSLLVYFYVLPKLGYVLVVPAAIYCFVISLMLWYALMSTMKEDTEMSQMQGAFGACSFYMSDLLLAINRWRLKIPLGPQLIIGSYYLAQLLIFLSVINSF